MHWGCAIEVYFLLPYTNQSAGGALQGSARVLTTLFARTLTWPDGIELIDAIDASMDAGHAAPVAYRTLDIISRSDTNAAIPG